MSEHILLTGATGLVGQYLLRDLLLREVPVAVLIRSSGKESASERLDRLLRFGEETAHRTLPRPTCLEGDITANNLGLRGEQADWAARHCTRVLHNAANLTFVGQDRAQDPWLSNKTGTDRVLDFCRRGTVREFHYVSTAYVCGNRTGPVLEEGPAEGDEFRNDYEASKFEAEQLVRNATFLDSATIYRPAVIVGDSVTGYTSSYHGLYSYLQFAWVLSQYATREADGRWHAPIRLNLTGDEPRNLVPVDWVAAVIAHLVQTPAHHGRTYHLTPPHPVTARELEGAIGTILRYYGPTFAGPNALASGEANALERTFYEWVSRYQPYWNREPIFDCTATLRTASHLPCPQIDTPMIGRLIDYAVLDRWGKRR